VKEAKTVFGAKPNQAMHRSLKKTKSDPKSKSANLTRAGE